LLAQSYLKGKLYLEIEPRPELLKVPDPYDPQANVEYRLHDASLYKGRYYLYFGAVPAVTLFLPYRLVTGHDLPNRVAVALFCSGGFLFYCYLFSLFAERNRWSIPQWLELGLIVCLGAMSEVGLLLRRPMFYEVAVAAGYCFVAGGFVLLSKAIFSPRADYRLFLAAGLMFGLAVGCRPDLLVVGGAAFAAIIFRAKQDGRAKRGVGAAIAFGAGIGACGLVLMWYNYARFDSPLEFGLTYQLGFFSQMKPRYSDFKRHARIAAYTAEKLLFLMPRLDRTFPFLHTVFINPLQGIDGPALWTEDMVGLFPAAPVALLGCFMPWLRAGKSKINNDSASAWILGRMYWSAVLVFLVLCGLGWSIGRYLVDFGPLLIFAGICLVAGLWQRPFSRSGSRVFACGCGIVILYGAVLNLALATPRIDLLGRFLRLTK
jgi:hypothetical protein